MIYSCLQLTSHMRLQTVRLVLNDLLIILSTSQDLLEGSQSHYIELEKKLRGDYSMLEKKYHKAKKLIKEYQARSDLIAAS